MKKEKEGQDKLKRCFSKIKMARKNETEDKEE